MSLDNRPNAATQAKKRWNAKHYTVIKVSVNPEVAADFKAACAASGVSMNGKLTQFMAEYCGAPANRKSKPDYSTRRQRRAAIKCFIEQIGQIRDAEERCRENVPENLRGSAAYEKADECASLLEEVVELLESIY
jgi:hypothetical protein